MKPFTYKSSAILNPAALQRISGIFLLLLAGFSTGFGADFWEKKNYKEWSQKECSKMLEDSPWAKTFALTSVQIMQSSGRDGATMGGEQQPYIKYLVQFRSATPVRQALVRQMQIAQKYDSLPPEQKQQFDNNAEAFLSGSMADAVIVQVKYTTNSQPNDLELARHWQSQTADLLKNSVYLIGSKGDKVPVAQYAAAPGGQREFQFIFPRQVYGKTVVGPGDKSLKLEFPYPIIGNMGDGRAFLEFKVEKLTFQGNITY